MVTNNPKKYLVIGLESSCTRYFARLLALNLGIIGDPSDWDGHYEVQNDLHMVVHRSLPHGTRHNYVDDWHTYDVVVMCTRDIHCTLQSKTTWHQPVRYLAEEENDKGRKILRDVIANRGCYLFSYETAWLLGDIYIEKILESLGLDYKKKLDLHDINHKYFIHTEKANGSHVKSVLKAIIWILNRMYNKL